MIRHFLASAQQRKDEVPNQELAMAIVLGKHPNACSELIDLLYDKDKKIQQDSIKVLYEIGEQQAELITPHLSHFLTLLNSNNNRMVWGAMIALHKITLHDPTIIYPHLPQILETIDKGSVITKDNGVFILIALAMHKSYADTAQALLLEQIKKVAINQLPMYAERSIHCWAGSYKKSFGNTLQERFSELGKASREKRIEKVLKSIE